LHGDEKTLLQQLAVHRGGASLASLVAVAATRGLNDATVAFLVAALVDKSIVSASFAGGAARYDLLDSVREYLLERLGESGRLAEARAAHAGYFSGATLFRQVGGSIGVSVFGAIFTNELGRELARRLPAGAHAPTHASPAAIQHLPPAIHAVYVAAAAVALTDGELRRGAPRRPRRHCAGETHSNRRPTGSQPHSTRCQCLREDSCVRLSLRGRGDGRHGRSIGYESVTRRADR
jgi:hypothetical protein